MATALSGVTAVISGAAAFALAWFTLASLGEREARAAALAGGGAIGAVALTSAILFAPSPADVISATAVLVAAAAGVVVSSLPNGRLSLGTDTPTTRVDERDIMFARARLEPGSPEYSAYYAMRPQNLDSDERTRALPGLGSPRAGKADPWAFAAMEASFSLTEAVRLAVDGPVAPERVQADPSPLTRYAKGLARYWGARSVGVTELRPYHVYSHVGRGEGLWGSPIEPEHDFAIALTVEMGYAHVRTSPEASEVMESAKQYVEAARVALQLAYLIRSLGYPARAHIDGNYRVIAPLVARDAGLGALGRMGLLMTPELGPRVRLAVVTTDLPLIADGRGDDRPVLDFCRICEKCAENCPSRSIPAGDRTEVDGVLRWRIDVDTCFRYWNSVGTDCGRCMSVCPFAHPDTAVHDAVRWGIRHSGAARRAALWADDLFYSRRPAVHPRPSWLPPHERPVVPE